MVSRTFSNMLSSSLISALKLLQVPYHQIIMDLLVWCETVVLNSESILIRCEILFTGVDESLCVTNSDWSILSINLKIYLPFLHVLGRPQHIIIRRRCLRQQVKLLVSCEPELMNPHQSMPFAWFPVSFLWVSSEGLSLTWRLLYPWSFGFLTFV